MDITRHLETLSQKDPDLRRQALAQVLDAEGLSYTLQEEAPAAKTPRGVCNYLLEPDSASPTILLCAHYDAVPGSFGANDNAASLCILIELARELRTRNIPARFAFFDGEESGNSGSLLYVDQADRESLLGAVNLDVCGYGDTLAICGKGHEKKPVMQPFCNKTLLDKHSAQILKYLPKSDETSFTKNRIPAISLAIVPRWDIQFLKTLATYGEGLFGRPPEFDMIVDQMEVTTTMHGGYRDTLEWVQPEAMQKVYDYLLDAMTAPVPEGRKRLFSRGL